MKTAMKGFAALAAVATTALTASCSVLEATDESASADSVATSWGSCDDAIDITNALANGGTYLGTTTGTATSRSTCGNSSLPVALLRIELPTDGNYRIDVRSALPDASVGLPGSTGEASAADGAVVIRSDCRSIVNELACNPSPASKQTFFGARSGGPVYVQVLGTSYAHGFSLTLKKLAYYCQADGDCRDFVDGTCNRAVGNCENKLACRGTVGDCNHDWSDGCETDLRADANNCGGCGSACDTHGGHATAARCENAACNLTCETDFANCDGKAANGCEANLKQDGFTCGACGNSCEGGVCTGGACVSRGEELAVIPGYAPDATDPYARNYGVGRLALSANRVVVRDTAYIPNVLSLRRGGGAPTSLGDPAEDFAAAPSSPDVWTVDIRTVRRVREDGTLIETIALGQDDDARVAGTDGSSLVTLNGAYGAPVAVRSVVPGAHASTVVWQPPTSNALLDPPVVTSTRIVVRPAAWSGSSYDDFWPSFVVVDRSTGATTNVDGVSGHEVAYAADERGVYWGDDGVYFAPYGGAATKLWSGVAVDSIALDANNVYFSARQACDGGHSDRSPSRIYAVPKTGGSARELAYDHVGLDIGTFAGVCSTTVGSYIAVDDTFVYWSSRDRVRRVRRPE